MTRPRCLRLCGRRRRSSSAEAGTVATDLALRHADRVRALVLLEPDASRELAPAAAEWVDRVVDRLRDVAACDGVDAVAEALIGEAAGEDAWRSFPRRFGARSRATDRRSSRSLAASGGFRRTSTIEQPALVVMAADSPPEFHQAPEALAEAIPNTRLSRVGGGHLIDPASPEVIAFVQEVLEGR
jgi:pimeloyl-ACP methyl ester carboxylesterase